MNQKALQKTYYDRFLKKHFNPHKEISSLSYYKRYYRNKLPGIITTLLSIPKIQDFEFLNKRPYPSSADYISIKKTLIRMIDTEYKFVTTAFAKIVIAFMEENGEYKPVHFTDVLIDDADIYKEESIY